jgi:hypothetical protein
VKVVSSTRVSAGAGDVWSTGWLGSHLWKGRGGGSPTPAGLSWAMTLRFGMRGSPGLVSSDLEARWTLGE